MLNKNCGSDCLGSTVTDSGPEKYRKEPWPTSSTRPRSHTSFLSYFHCSWAFSLRSPLSKRADIKQAVAERLFPYISWMLFWHSDGPYNLLNPCKRPLIWILLFVTHWIFCKMWFDSWLETQHLTLLCVSVAISVVVGLLRSTEALSCSPALTPNGGQSPCVCVCFVCTYMCVCNSSCLDKQLSEMPMCLSFFYLAPCGLL